jgi:hypothetical protein
VCAAWLLPDSKSTRSTKQMSDEQIILGTQATEERAAAALLIEAENNRTILRGTIAKVLPQSAVLPKQGVTSDELLRSIEKLPGLKFTYGSGTMVGQTTDGKTVNLDGLVERALLASPGLADGRSTRHVQAGSVELFRSEMSLAQKAEFLKTHSPEEFGALPLKRTSGFVADDQMTRKQYLSLSLRQKTALAFTEAQISAIMRRK